jgi:starch phosphorylase
MRPPDGERPLATLGRNGHTSAWDELRKFTSRESSVHVEHEVIVTGWLDTGGILEEQDSDPTVMGAGLRSSVWHQWVGGLTDEVVHKARGPVLVVKTQAVAGTRASAHAADLRGKKCSFRVGERGVVPRDPPTWNNASRSSVLGEAAAPTTDPRDDGTTGGQQPMATVRKPSTTSKATRSVAPPPTPSEGAAPFAGAPGAAYEQRLVLDHVLSAEHASQRDRFEAAAWAVRDHLARRWVETNDSYDRANPKQVYYLSMEFLIGRSLANNILNLGAEPLVREALNQVGLDWRELAESEPDAGLGNGGLGRLAACFLDSLATLRIPAIGYGLRYEYGMFRQGIVDGRQVERPDPWLRRPDPWEVVRPGESVEVGFHCSIGLKDGRYEPIPNVPSKRTGIPYDRPIVGYHNSTVNTLRLWGAGTHEDFNFLEFSQGDFFDAVHEQVAAESLTRVLYPNDSTPRGKRLRFVQEYFLVACSLADIVRRFRARGNAWPELPVKVAIQLNDTHPALAVAELMRILLDEARLGWDEAWDLTVRTLAYTNHTLLPEALETWPVELFELAVPRHLEIIYEINRRFLDDVRGRASHDEDIVRRVSLIQEVPEKRIRMAHLAVVGAHSTNGVAAIHSRLLRSTVLKDLSDLFPERFNNKTNGVTPRRWLRLANPDLSDLLCSAIGDDWIADLSGLERLVPLAGDASFRESFGRAKRAARVRFADWLRASTGEVVDPDSIFDAQVKRIHEYKRQLLNVLNVLVQYQRIRDNPSLDVPPRTVFFAGKAAPAYVLAKQIIHLINNVASLVDADPAVKGRLKVLFLPEYNVTLAQRLIPACDVSQQISTAGFEASGTSNMKFMMNGALTVGTRDGATIEMAEAAGEENFFLFGLTAEEVRSSRSWYDPHWHYEHEAETRRALDLITSDAVSRGQSGLFQSIRDVLLTQGDFYRHLADLSSYVATQDRVGALYMQPDDWARKAVLNVAHSGRFSSDRAIAEYAEDIWGVEPCAVPETSS